MVKEKKLNPVTMVLIIDIFLSSTSINIDKLCRPSIHSSNFK